MQKGLESLFHMQFFGYFGKKKVSKRFQNEEWSIQLTQCFFLRNLVLWVNMFIEEDSMPLVDFIDWV